MPRPPPCDQHKASQIILTIYYRWSIKSCIVTLSLDPQYWWTVTCKIAAHPDDWILRKACIRDKEAPHSVAPYKLYTYWIKQGTTYMSFKKKVLIMLKSADVASQSLPISNVVTLQQAPPYAFCHIWLHLGHAYSNRNNNASLMSEGMLIVIGILMPH